MIFVIVLNIFSCVLNLGLYFTQHSWEHLLAAGASAICTAALMQSLLGRKNK